MDAAGTTRRLLGVDRSGGESMCVQGHGIWDGPVDDTAIKAIARWKANAVRIPLNEECRLGVSGIKPEYGGTHDIDAVKDLVVRVEAHGMTPILDLHWSYGQYTGNSAGCSDVHATCQKPMPDRQYSPSFWASVASTFKDDPAPVFDLRRRLPRLQLQHLRHRELLELHPGPGRRPSAAGRRGDR